MDIHRRTYQVLKHGRKHLERSCKRKQRGRCTRRLSHSHGGDILYGRTFRVSYPENKTPSGVSPPVGGVQGQHNHTSRHPPTITPGGQPRLPLFEGTRDQRPSDYLRHSKILHDPPPPAISAIKMFLTSAGTRLPSPSTPETPAPAPPAAASPASPLSEDPFSSSFSSMALLRAESS